MGKQLVAKLRPLLARAKWPQTPAATPHGRQTYLMGLDKVDEFKGHPQTLAAAWRIVLTGDSAPYAYAGAAYTLVAAAQESDNHYDPGGLEAAMTWLEKAQELEPDLVEINMIEALVYVYSGRLDDARLVLDYLQSQDPRDYYLLKAEIAYWRALKDVEQTVHWFNQAAAAAANVPQKLRLRSQLADFYMSAGQYDKALAIYKEAALHDKNNHIIWHKMSLIYWKQADYEQAAYANQQALRRQDFPAGRKMEAALKEKLSGTGVLGRLFGNK